MLSRRRLSTSQTAICTEQCDEHRASACSDRNIGRLVCNPRFWSLSQLNAETLHVQGEPDLDAFIMVEVSGRDLCCKTPLDLIVGIIRTRIKSAAEVRLITSSTRHDNPDSHGR
jgi:hypothetical protein